MTLKSFFSANQVMFGYYRENMKRRSWVCLLCAFVLFLSLPLRHAMEINANLLRLERNQLYYSSWQSPEEALQQMFLNAISADVLTGVLIMGLAIIFAVQGFSWMDNSRKLDLYMSVPVSSRKRFIYIYVNGIWFFAITYLIAMLLTVLVASLMGAGSAKIFGAAMLIWLGNMILYLACYNLTLIAVMLTGKVLITLCGTAVLFGYEYLIRNLFDYLRRTFFRTYSAYSEISSDTITSPIYTWAESIVEGAGWFTGELPHPGVLFRGFGILAAQAFVYGLAAWFLYRKRKSEAAGKAMAFGISKPVIRFALVIPSALFAALWFWELSSESIVFAVIGLIVGVLVVHCLIQVIYEADIRSIFSKKWQLGIACAVSAVIFAWFYLDLSGYDSYIPETEDIEEVAVAFPNDIYTIRLYDNLFAEDMVHRNRTEYMLGNMKATDPDTIEAVRQLAFLDMQQEKDQDYYEEGTIAVVIRYGLKNGNEKYRMIMAECDEVMSQMDLIFEDDSFRQARYQIMDPAFVQNADKIRIAYENGIASMNYLEDTEELLKTYAEELKSYNFSMIQNELPVGSLSVRYYPYWTESTDDWYQWTYPVYAEFIDTIRLLSENGAYLEPKKNGAFLESDEVVSVTITCMNLLKEDMEVDYNGNMTVSYSDERRVSETFSDEKDIAAILPALYPETLCDVAGNVMRQDLNTSNYSVVVAFSNESGHKMQNQYFVVVEDKLPEYIREKLAYKSETE